MIEPGLFDMIMRLRSSGISDTNVLRAMETIPRSAFVPDNLKMQSYDERDLPIACGQTLTAPLTTAIMCQTLDVRPEHKVLLIGTGSGYSTAILSKLCTRVYAVERYKTLSDAAEAQLKRHAPNAVLRHGEGRLGWRGQAPFDRIMVCASVRMLPNALLSQLKPDGKMAAVVGNMLTTAKTRNGKTTETQVLKLTLPPIETGKSKSM